MRFKIVAQHSTLPERKHYSDELYELRMLSIEWVTEGYTSISVYQWIEDTQEYKLIHKGGVK